MYAIYIEILMPGLRSGSTLPIHISCLVDAPRSTRGLGNTMMYSCCILDQDSGSRCVLCGHSLLTSGSLLPRFIVTQILVPDKLLPGNIRIWTGVGMFSIWVAAYMRRVDGPCLVCPSVCSRCVFSYLVGLLLMISVSVAVKEDVLFILVGLPT
jgi:hypothetical protein